MSMTRRVLMGVAMLGLAACSSSDPGDQMAKREEINANANAAMNQLFAEDPAARELADNAQGILIFPNIVKAGLGVGGETGDGVLRVDDRNAGYYNTSSASIGLQVGAQSYSQVLMFMTDQALADFQSSQGWEAGVDGSVAVLDVGKSADIDTSNIQTPIVGYIFGESGLMADVAIEGSKYTKLNL